MATLQSLRMVFVGGRNELRSRLSEMFLGTKQRIVRRVTDHRTTLSPSYDIGTNDYEYWKKARQGKVQDIQLAALLLKPLESKIASWTLGQPPTVILKNKRAMKFVSEWLRDTHHQILGSYQDSLGLGDAFVLINPDLSMVVFSPDVVTPIVDDEDFSSVIGWKVTQVIPHPEEPTKKMTIVNEFKKNRRHKTVYIDGKQISSRGYNNLIGMIPIIHIPNAAAAYERFGHPEGEALVPLMQAYTEVLHAAMEGNIKQGRPTPVVRKLGTPQEVDQFWSQYATTVTKTEEDGQTVSYHEVEFDSDRLVALGGDADFGWEAPGNFTEDTRKILELLFYLYLQHSELPEFILGNAVKTGADATGQIEPLVKFIEKKRSLAKPWLKEVVKVALAYRGLWDISMRNSNEPEIFWESLTRQDGTLTLQTVQWAYLQGLIDRKTAVTLMPLDIANPEQAIQDAEEDYAKRPVQGYPSQNGTDPQMKPGESSERSRRRSGVDRNGKQRNRRSDSRSVSPYANSGA